MSVTPTLPPQGPRVSVTLAALNSASWIGRTIASLATQTLTDIEIILIDDGSTDATPEIMETWARRDARIRHAILPHQGISTALNTATGMARAPYVARIDSDDIALPDRLAKQAAFLDANPKVGVVGGQMVGIDERDRKVTLMTYALDDLQKHVLLYSPLGHPATMFRRDLVVSLGGYRPTFDAAEDYDLWLRIAERAGLANLPDVVTYYRYHSQQLTRRLNRRQHACALVAQSAAATRRRGEPDPIPEDFVIDSDSVATLGFPEERVELIRQYLR